MKSDGQTQAPAPFRSRHCAFVPQGFGIHGFDGIGSGDVESAGVHLTLGSPVYPSVQEQIGEWYTTLHLAKSPQAPGHGFLHL